MTVYKFSKSYGNIFKIKKDFYLNNNNHLKKSLSVNNVYKSQPLRKFCKICNSKKLEKFINSFGIDYLICKKCSHLNGKFDDTGSFRNYLYFKSSGKIIQKITKAIIEKE